MELSLTSVLFNTLINHINHNNLMKRKFEILQSNNLSQIQMWLNQKNTVKGNLKIESSPMKDDTTWIIIVSYDDN
jgi:hypothetical protein